MPLPSEKTRAEFIIGNELGLHFRAAALVVRTLEEFASSVTISNGESKADARSVLDLMTLAAARGTPIVVEAEGPDAEAAVAALGRLIGANFDE
jgi:phosphotransferase system HPr (HPr) family protein